MNKKNVTSGETKGTSMIMSGGLHANNILAETETYYLRETFFERERERVKKECVR